MASRIINALENDGLFTDRVEEVTQKVSHADVKEVINNIKTELHKDKELVSLCAPQIGKNLRLFVVKTAENKYREYLNPMIVTSSKETHLSFENNASFPNKNFIIPRKNEIHLAYQTHDGHVESESYTGVYAEVIQQMVEMLDGLTLLDYGFDLDACGGVDAFNAAPEKDRIEVINMYLDTLKQISNDLSGEISKDDELKQMSDTYEFTKKYLSGEIKPVDAEGNVVEMGRVDE